MIWRPLLLSLWYLHLANAQGDPIPEEVFSALSSTTLRSFEDLRSLLRIDSVEEEEEHSWRNRTKNHSTMSRSRRSLEVEAAVIAECKPRTEVFHISRGLVDPTNANFLVWPPCVEVQRCSGCCNTKTMKCTASLVQQRQVQVNKIEISPRKKPVFHKVLVALEDHLQCHCQPLAGAARHAHPPPTPEPPGETTVTTTPRPRTPALVESRERTRPRPAKRKHRKYKHLLATKTLKELYAP
ncbi:platelet-derived growth factor subunit B [Ambystoma mexicanum]|uniref:platelet-derived growth factor subunit B n=1 Tax=Ambystoma mexicanum TaxID=8296 RepID=UPI0037E94A11